MENKEKNKPGQQDQSSEPKKVNQPQTGNQPQEKESDRLDLEQHISEASRKQTGENADSPEKEEERYEGLEKTHQSEHQPLPGEGTDEAKGIAEDESKEDGKDQTA